jgi:hypothetical protein
MKESGYYPAGAQFDPRAPYNEPQDKDFVVSVTVSFTIRSCDSDFAKDTAEEIADSIDRLISLNASDVVIDDLQISEE